MFDWSSILMLGIVILISSVIVKTGAIALRLTGLDDETASFQALSAFSNTGFTTREAERIVNHPIRRSIIKILILLGNAGTVTVIVTMIQAFGKGTTGGTVLQLVLLALVLYLLYRFAIAKRVKKIIDRFIEKGLSSIPQLKIADFQEILSLSGSHAVSSVEVHSGNPVVGMTLRQAGLNRINVLILAVQREDQNIVMPNADTVIQPGDRLVAYGKTESIKRIAEGSYHPASGMPPNAEAAGASPGQPA